MAHGKHSGLLMAKIGNRASRKAQAGDPVPSQGEIEPEPLNLTANVSEERMTTGPFAWESQAAQYPRTGPPGISYFRAELPNNSDKLSLFVHCLLYRDETGELVGILNHYPTDLPPLQREGDRNVWVRPDRRRQGIGSALLTEAMLRWTPTRDPHLTESGVRLVEGMEEKMSVVARVLPAPPDVVYDEWFDAEGMREWMCPRPAVPTGIEIDPRVGGQYRIDIDDEGLALSVTGRYHVLDRPNRLALTWHCTNWEPSAPETVVLVHLEPRDEGRTLMTIRHSRLPADLSDDYKAGWGRIAAQLEERLAGR
jgi:uncharacterized protein YndB with AHSA1/START domain